ncbi:MAG: restriction endonuclease subunit S [Verrucomicrobia bacterium]|nr:MAG: restriction endonuclease subunit S [Verrucomicrobiota bacterium]
MRGIGTNLNLTPKLRFPEFRDGRGWATKRLGQLCKIRTGKKDANEGAESGPYPFFTCAENHIYSQSYSFDAEAILVAGNANVGQTKYFQGKFEAYQRTYVLTDFSDIHVPYLYTTLNAHLRPSLLQQVQTSAMSYIKLPMLEEYELAAPTVLGEQQKIAECLGTLDELIGAESQKLEALKAHKKGLMQQLFPRAGETLPRLRFPEFEGAEEWSFSSLGSLCKIRTGKKDANEGTENGLYPFFTCAENHIYSNSYSFDAEAILIAGNANVGQAKYYNGKFEAYQRTYVLTDFADIHVPYLYALLSANLRPALLTQVQVSAMSYIRLPMLEEFQIGVPASSGEQERIAICLSSIDDLIAAQSAKLEALKTHKRGLMQQLFPPASEAEA